MMLHMTEKEPSRLRKLREDAGLTLRELARQIGQQSSNVSYWETTGKTPKSDVLLDIAQALNVSVEELLGAPKPLRKGPSGRARLAFEQVSELPRSQQKKILDVVDAMLAQAKAS